MNNDCFSDSLHPDDKGYGLIFDAFRDTPGSPVPSTPPPDGSWPYATSVTPISSPPTVAPISTPPTISGLLEARPRFALGSDRHRRGTVFYFHLDRPAKIRIVIERTAPGRRLGQACRPPSHRFRNNRRCTRTIPIITIVKQEPAGLDRIAFTGRVYGHALSPGHYVAVLVALNSAGASFPQSIQFTVTRG